MSKISELSDGGALQSTDYLIAVRSGGNVKVQPAGMTFSSVTITSSDINGGNIDGTVIGAATPAAATFSSLTATTADINGGTIDGVTIGGSSAGAGSFTTLTASGDVSIADKIVHTGDTNTSIRFPAADTVTVETAGSERLRIDSGGNVGLGVTPSAWTNTSKVLQLPNGITFANAGSSIGYIGQNWFIDSGGGGNKYIANGAAALYGIGDGQHQWFTAASGTAGNTISFSEAMRIDTSGNVGIGTSSPAANHKLNIDQAGYVQALLSTSGTARLSLYGDAAVSAVDAKTNPLALYAGSSERMRITSAGNVGIGTSFPYAKTVVALAPTVTATTVNETADFADQFVIASSGASANGDRLPLIFNLGGDDADSVSAGIVALREASGWNTALSFWTNNVTSGPEGTDAIQEKMRIDSSGRLLVGTTSNLGGGVLQIDANSVGETIYTAYISNTSTSTSAYNVMRWEQGAAGSARGMIGTGGSATGNAAFRNSFVVGTQTSSPLVFATADAERARIDSSGNLLVGTTNTVPGSGNTATGCALNGNLGIGYFSRSTDASLILNTNADGSICRIYRSGTQVGSISVTTTATAYNTSSDYRLKDVDGPVTNSGAYIDALRPVQGSWKADGSRFIGLIAHEVQEVSETPIATGEKDGEEMQGMDYSAPELIANLIAEIQSLRARVAQLEGA